MVTTAKNFITAFNITKVAVGRVDALPIINETVRLRVAKGKAHLIATNLTAGITVPVELSEKNIAETFDVVLPAKRVGDWLDALEGDGPLALSVATKPRLELRVRFRAATTSAAAFVCLPPDEFPLIPHLTRRGDSASFSVSFKDLRRMFAVRWSASPARLALVTTGLNLRGNGQRLTAQCTDKYRVAQVFIDAEIKCEAVLPVPEVAKLDSLLARYTGAEIATLAVDERNLTLHADDFVWTAILLEGKYPEMTYQAGDQTACFDFADFCRCLKTAAIIARETNGTFEMRLTAPGGCAFFAQAAEVGDALAEMDTEASRSINLWLSDKFVDAMTALAEVNGEDKRLIMRYTTEHAPVVFNGAGWAYGIATRTPQ